MDGQLHQRKEKRKAAAADKPSVKNETKKAEPEKAGKAAASVEENDAEKEDPLLMFKAMILPSALIGVVACVVYGAASLAT
jgi:hypothetical protein